HGGDRGAVRPRRLRAVGCARGSRRGRVQPGARPGDGQRQPRWHEYQCARAGGPPGHPPEGRHGCDRRHARRAVGREGVRLRGARRPRLTADFGGAERVAGRAQGRQAEVPRATGSRLDDADDGHREDPEARPAGRHREEAGMTTAYFRADVATLQQRCDELSRRLAIEMRLSQAAAAGKGIAGLVREIVEMTPNPLWLIDQRRRVVARSVRNRGSDFAPPDVDLLLEHNGPVDLTAAEPLVIEPDPPRGVVRRHLLMPVARGGSLFAWLVMAEVARRFRTG